MCILIGLEIFIFHFFSKIKMQPPNGGFFFFTSVMDEDVVEITSSLETAGRVPK